MRRSIPMSGRNTSTFSHTWLPRIAHVSMLRVPWDAVHWRSLDLYTHFRVQAWGGGAHPASGRGVSIQSRRLFR